MEDQREPPSARFEFPSMLYDLLEDCTFGDDKDIVSWESHGQTFKIHKRDEVSIRCFDADCIPSCRVLNGCISCLSVRLEGIAPIFQGKVRKLPLLA